MVAQPQRGQGEEEKREPNENYQRVHAARETTYDGGALANFRKKPQPVPFAVHLPSDVSIKLDKLDFLSVGQGGPPSPAPGFPRKLPQEAVLLEPKRRETTVVVFNMKCGRGGEGSGATRVRRRWFFGDMLVRCAPNKLNYASHLLWSWTWQTCTVQQLSFLTCRSSHHVRVVSTNSPPTHLAFSAGSKKNKAAAGARDLQYDGVPQERSASRVSDSHPLCGAPVFVQLVEGRNSQNVPGDSQEKKSLNSS